MANVFFRFGLGLISYGIAYGIQRLAGNIYLNMFLFSLVEIPGKFVVLWLLTKYVWKRNRPVHENFVHIAFAKKPSINAHFGVSSGTMRGAEGGAGVWTPLKNTKYRVS